jgi:hypothetical protein
MKRRSRLDPQTQLLMWKGAKLGAILFGSLGFVTGITICVAYHLPFPPIAVTEMGALIGGLGGALAGYCWRYPAGRSTWIGLMLGGLLGVPVAAWVPGWGLRLLTWLACVLMSAVVGYQAGAAGPDAGRGAWKLHGRRL